MSTLYCFNEHVESLKVCSHPLKVVQCVHVGVRVIVPARVDMKLTRFNDLFVCLECVFVSVCVGLQVDLQVRADVPGEPPYHAL